MSLCILPWIHFEATAQGFVRPCCQYSEDIPNSKLSENSVKDIWTGEYMQKLRKDFLAGKMPKGCSKCWQAEASGHRSKRQQDNERFSHHMYRANQALGNPVYLDLKLGTICNIKCRSCSSESSSKWAEDEKLIYGKPFNPFKSHWVEEDSDFWTNLEQILDDIEFIDFTGGEPFLIKRHVQVLHKCVERGLAPNISIHYNTNGTIMPTDEMFDLWKHFKWVEIMFSFDGIEEKFEYIRHPAKWNQVSDVFHKVKSKNYLHTSICHTVSIFNVYYLPEFLQWFEKQELEDHQLYLNLLYYPEYYCIKNISSHQKKVIADKLTNERLESIVNFMQDGGINKVNEFKKMTKKIDVIRKESFKKTFPKLNEILK